MTRTTSPQRKSASPTTAKSVWPATEPTLQPSITLIRPTARFATCRRPPAPMWLIPRSRITASRATQQSLALSPDANPVPVTQRLVPFPDSAEAEHDVRDLALAWQSLANGGMEAAEPHAEALLRSAVAEFPNDPDLLSALAYVEQRHGLTAPARELYRRALAVNPGSDRRGHRSGRDRSTNRPPARSCRTLAGGIPARAWQKQRRHEPGCGIL